MTVRKKSDASTIRQTAWKTYNAPLSLIVLEELQKNSIDIYFWGDTKVGHSFDVQLKYINKSQKIIRVTLNDIISRWEDYKKTWMDYPVEYEKLWEKHLRAAIVEGLAELK